MPAFRIMNWNIEKLSCNKIRIGNMADLLAGTIVSALPDIVVIVELCMGEYVTTMEMLTTAMNDVAQNSYGLNQHSYRAWVVSLETGGELYGYMAATA